MYMGFDFDLEEVRKIEQGFDKSSKKPKDERAPKRPRSAFFIWAHEMRPSVMKELGEHSDIVKIPDIGRELGSRWKDVTKEERGPWNTRAIKEKKEYEIKVEKYKKTSGYKNHLKKILAWKIHETKKPYKKPADMPKKNLSSFLIFVNSTRPKIQEQDPDKKSTEIVTEISKQWQAMGAKDREPWNKKAALEKKKHEKIFKEYCKKDSYKAWAADRDQYKAEMKAKRNKLMGIKKKKKRGRPTGKDDKKSPSRKRTKKRMRSTKKKSNKRSRQTTPKRRGSSDSDGSSASMSRSESRSSKSRTPPKRKSRTSRRSSRRSRRGSRRRSRRRKATRRSKKKSKKSRRSEVDSDSDSDSKELLSESY